MLLLLLYYDAYMYYIMQTYYWYADMHTTLSLSLSLSIYLSIYLFLSLSLSLSLYVPLARTFSWWFTRWVNPANWTAFVILCCVVLPWLVVPSIMPPPLPLFTQPPSPVQAWHHPWHAWSERRSVWIHPSTSSMVEKRWTGLGVRVKVRGQGSGFRVQGSS
jgi:hypothetical protein